MSKKTKIFVIVGMICFAALIIGLLVGVVLQKPSEDSEISYNQFLKMVEKEKVEEITLNYSSDTMKILDQEEKEYIVPNPRYEDFKKDMLEKGIEVSEVSIPDFSAYIIVIFYGFFIFIMFRMIRSQGLQNDVEIKKTDRGENAITFDEVAGLSEVKKDMITFVDFLKNKKAYTKMGAKLPRGIILYGPPGTGKTLLAKAVAEEADVPFFYMSGSDFVELFVGMGAKRVRQLFEKAKKSAPCIIFIDEIDAVGGTRNAMGSSSEDRKTINALLTEMDGFQDSENILVIGATNRIEDLDPALLRPGRFSEKFCVSLPETIEERLESIELYAQGKTFAKDVDFQSFGKETIGCSPADIENILNEAAIIAVQEGKQEITKEILDQAMFKKLVSGHAKKHDMQEKEMQLIAYHEAGHALVGTLLGLEVNKVTIIGSTTGAGGVTITTPKKMGLYTKNELHAQIKQLYAGRCGEYLLVKDWNEITTGASNDIEVASNLILELITNYGMTQEFDMLNLKNFMDQKSVLEQAQAISKELKEETLHLMQEHEKELQQIASELIEKETLHTSDLQRIIGAVL